MKTFLINYVLITKESHPKRNSKQHRTILVEAEDKIKATQTLEKYWHDKSEEFEISYTVESIDIAPFIRQSEVLK